MNSDHSLGGAMQSSDIREVKRGTLAGALLSLFGNRAFGAFG